MRRVAGKGARRALGLALAASVLVPGATAAVATPAAAVVAASPVADVGVLPVGSLGARVSARRYPTPYRRSTRVVLLGDSLAQESAPFVQYLTSPRAFVPKFWGGTAPCDWATADLQANRRTVVVITFTGNSLTPCMVDGAGGFLTDQALVDQYRHDVGALVDRARRAGASVVLVGQPVRAAQFEADVEVAGINAVYAEMAAAITHVSYVDAGAAVEGADGTFVERLPCTAYDADCAADGLTVVRGDGVHFCPVVDQSSCPVWSSGAFRFAMAMAAAANDPRAYD